MSDLIEIEINEDLNQLIPEITVQVNADPPVKVTGSLPQSNPLPKGGSIGQILTKKSSSDYHVGWTSLEDMSLWLDNQLR